MPDRRKLPRWLTPLVIAAVLLCWAYVLQRQFTAISGHPWQIAPYAFAFGLFFATLYFSALAICWALLLQRMGGNVVGLAMGARVWLLSMVTRYIPGNIWHIVGRVAFAERLRVPATLVFASATIEQLLTLLGAFTLLAISLPFWQTAGVSPAPVLGEYTPWLLLGLPLGLVLLHPLALGKLMHYVARLTHRPQLAWVYRYSDIVLLLGAYVVATCFHGLALAAVVSGFAPLQNAQLPLLVGAAALAWMLGYLSFVTPSGLGVREGVLTALLAQIYPLPVAIVASLLFRLVCTLGELLAVGLASFVPIPPPEIN